ncbi:hypothetical protein BDB01DRAFT_894942 [Pilobolus umbonatus]|nr:hypothetical protein BDB01DRAFT_894942 [Pilobolus umbonatus]
MFFRKLLIVSALVSMLSTVVDAHPSLTPKYVEPNQAVNASIYVPHGCDGSATIELTVMVPENVAIIVPEPFSNWTVFTTYRDEVTEELSEFTWSGGYLAADASLYFPLNITIPNIDLSSQPNVTLYFPVHQKCEVGWSNWTLSEDHAHNADHNSQGKPAPFMVVVKNATEAALMDKTTEDTVAGESDAATLIITSVPFIATLVTIAFSML